MSRSALLVFLLGLLAGAGLGLYLGWVIAPAQIVDASPDMLSPEAQADYVQMAAAIYAADGDAPAARARLSALGDPQAALDAAAVFFTAAGADEESLRRLTSLAAAIGEVPPELQPYLP